jgi:iron(III) transport system permease protein
MLNRRVGRTVVLGGAAAVFVLCGVLPVAYLCTISLAEARPVASALWLDARQRALLFNTTLLGVGVAALSAGIGVPLGVVLARVPLKRKPAIRVLLAAPILLPPYVMALAWTFAADARWLASLVGREVLAAWTFSMPAAILVLSLVCYPLAMLASEVGLRRIDGRLEEAALVAASPGRVLRRITLPLAAPAVIAAALVTFVIAVSDFGVPGLLRVRVYTTEIFTAFAALYDFPRALVLAAPMLLVCAGAGVLATWMLGDRLVSAARLTGRHPPLFEHWRGTARLAVAAVVVLALVLPIIVLARETLDVRSIRTSIGGAGEAIANSLLLAAFGATVVTAVGVGLGYARARARVRSGTLADVLFVVVFAVPPTIVGVALIGLWNRPGIWGTVYGTSAMFVLVYLARFLPVAALALAAAVRYVPISQEEAAAAAGAGWVRGMRRIVLPQVRLGVAAAWTAVFVLSFGELGASVLIAPPGESTLPIRIYTMIANAPPAEVATLAFLQAIVAFMPLAALATVASRVSTRGHGAGNAGMEREGR